MRILQIIPHLRAGGAEIMVENLTYELIALGHDVNVISLYDFTSPITQRLESRNIRVHFLHKKRGLDYSIIKKLVDIFIDYKPDIIHTHLYVMIYAIPAANKSHVKGRVHTVHSVAKKENAFFHRLLCRGYYHHCNVLPVALSNIIKQTIIEEYKITEVPVAFNGIDLNRCIIKEDYHIENIIRIIHVGRFAKVKNHSALIKGFSIFHQTHPNAELSFIGTGELEKSSRLLVSALGLAECIHFLGVQADVYPFLNQADIFILPSLWEGTPMTLMEAMGTGLPIIASNVGGIPDMIEDKKEGFLVEPSPQEIADALAKLSEDDVLRADFGRNAFLGAERFSSKITAKNYYEIYKRAMIHKN